MTLSNDELIRGMVEQFRVSPKEDLIADLCAEIVLYEPEYAGGGPTFGRWLREADDDGTATEKFGFGLDANVSNFVDLDTTLCLEDRGDSEDSLHIRLDQKMRSLVSAWLAQQPEAAPLCYADIHDACLEVAHHTTENSFMRMPMREALTLGERVLARRFASSTEVKRSFEKLSKWQSEVKKMLDKDGPPPTKH
jgi:hypothetical protein